MSITLNPKAHLFLTSLPGGYSVEGGEAQTKGFFEKNEFIELLKSLWKEKSKILYITASPNRKNASNFVITIFSKFFKISNFSFSCIDLCDDDNYKQKLEDYDVVILGWGHVPTQNKFFEKINLAERIKTFEGIIFAVSAGSMNSPKEAYAQPELPGEAKNPKYQRFLKGLGITEFQIVPHYHWKKKKKLDGYRIIEDITYNDSIGRCLYVIPNGSYIYQTTKEAYMYGEAYKVQDKIMTKICDDGNKLKLY